MTPAPRRRAIWLVATALFLASAAYLTRTFQWREAFALLARADFATFVAGSGAALLAYWAVRAWRWRMIMQAMGVRCGFVSRYLCSSVALSLSVFTPLQSGELLKIELLRKCVGAGRLPGYSAFALERVADLYAIIALGLVAAASSAVSTPQALAVAAGLFVLPLAAYPLGGVTLPKGRVGDFLAHMRTGVGSPYALLIFMTLTFASWLLVAAAWYACLRGVSITLGIAELLGLLCLATLATLLSFVPAGLGVAEASISGILISYGVEPALAQAGALALRAFSVLVIALGALHFLWLRRHLKRIDTLARSEANEV